MAEKPVFVVFEGMDGCGKSTVGAMVAARLGAEWLSPPPAAFADFRNEIDGVYKGRGLAQQLFYASTVAYASALVKEAKDAGNSVVMDRYAASTLAYDKIARDSGKPDAFWVEGVFSGVAVPDVVFYVEASGEIRKRRMEGRKEKGATDEDSIQKETQLSQRYETVLKLLGEHSWVVRRVKNETTPEECVDACMKEIMHLRG